MTLSNISLYGKDNERADLHIDGSVLKSFSSVVIRFGLFEGMELSRELYEEVTAETEIRNVRDRGAKILSHRRLSKGELGKKLVEKGASEDQASAAADWFEEIGVINDFSYAEAVARKYAEKGYGEKRIRYELYKRHIPGEMWDDAISALEPFDNALNTLLDKKLKNYSGDRKELKQTADSLVRRGFSWGEVNAALRRFEDSLEGMDV